VIAHGFSEYAAFSVAPFLREIFEVSAWLIDSIS
jgi:hypothetical protein